MIPDASENARLLRISARAVGRAGLAHAYGHCSLRIDADHFMVTPAKPLGLVEPEEECPILSVHEPIPDHILGEVRIHREIYHRRPEVHGIVRAMPENVMTMAAFRAVPQPRHGFGSYFYPEPELWDDIQLLRSDDSVARLADQMGNSPAIIMRGNGSVVAGDSIEQAVTLTWYLEDMARIELAGRAAQLEAQPLDERQCASRATWKGAISERMFQYLSFGDPEI